jgi:hypothetical protein
VAVLLEAALIGDASGRSSDHQSPQPKELLLEAALQQRLSSPAVAERSSCSMATQPTLRRASPAGGKRRKEALHRFTAWPSAA